MLSDDHFKFGDFLLTESAWVSWSHAAHEYSANELAMDSAYSDRIVQSAVCRNHPNFVAEFSVHADWMEDFGCMPFSIYFLSNDLEFNLIYVSCSHNDLGHNDLFFTQRRVYSISLRFFGCAVLRQCLLCRTVYFHNFISIFGSSETTRAATLRSNLTWKSKKNKNKN